MEELVQLNIYMKEKFENNKNPEKYYSDQLNSKVEKVIWATEPQQYLELLKIERSRIPKGKILKEEPINKENCVKLSYNKFDELIFEEKWGSHPTHGFKKYFTYSNETICSYSFTRESVLTEIEYQKLEEGIPIEYANYSIGKANVCDKYEYQNGMLVRINTLWQSDPYIQFPEYHINYDLFENIETIRRIDEPSDFFPEGQNIVIYKKHNYSIRQLTEIFIKETIKCITKEIGKNRDKNLLLIVLEHPFNGDEWLPFKFYFLKSIKELKKEMNLEEYIDVQQLNFEYQSNLNNQIIEASELLMQEMELKEKYGLPHKILKKIGQKIKKEGLEGKHTFKILLLDFPDDYSEDLNSILLKLYSNKEIRLMK